MLFSLDLPAGLEGDSLFQHARLGKARFDACHLYQAYRELTRIHYFAIEREQFLV